MKEKKITLNFNPKARLLLQLGDQLIKNEKVALSELVKNSYDACARYTKVNLYKVHTDKHLTQGKIIIQDDGFGMDKKIIETVWMEPGTNNKENIKNNFNNLSKEEDNLWKRLPIGEKGIGRFGVHKLGYKIKLISKMKNKNEIELNINWRQFEQDSYLLDEKIELLEREEPKKFLNGTTGTLIEIENIRKQWTISDIREVYRSIQSLTSPFNSKDDFVVEFNVDENKIIDNLFDPLELPDINLWYFRCDILEDENDKSKTRIKNFEFKFSPYEKMLEKLQERIIKQEDPYIKDDELIYLEKDVKEDGKKETEYEYLPLEGIGSFSFEGYIFDLDAKTLNDSEKIKDKSGFKNYLKENGGVRVYREDLRVYDYGEQENDWLDLAQSRVNDPSSSIGNNQILAAINLNMSKSKELIEKTNREGFVENTTYKTFKNIVKIVLDKIAFLRNEDKDKIRAIHVKEIDSSESAYSLINTVKSDIVKNVDDKRVQNKMIINLDKIQDNYSEIKELLLKSSGSGLTYGIITHQMQKIVTEIKYRVKNKSDETLQELVNSLNLTIESIMNLFIVTEKDEYNAVEFIKNQKNSFNYRFKKHDIEYTQAFDDDNDSTLYIAENFVSGSILNIIDNSIFWLEHWFKLNKGAEKKKIRIDIKESDNFTNIIISDNGIGFLINVETAVMPFKTTKKLKDRGTGIGLYYVSEAMKVNNGELYIPITEEEKKKYSIPKEFLRGATVILRLQKEEK
ncbi:sensor histidine kinase [Malaciobacter marinus]|uniref:sensor histidine kinase n=1 Tax=Malaciobacter marinus TaxID=505249 RepID=UPI003B006F01